MKKKINNQNDAYWLNAAKQIPWPVDLRERHISVPHNEVAEAQAHLMVQHFVNNGFFIQLCIEAPRTKVFDPKIEYKLPVKRIAPDGALFHVGDQFMVVSTDDHLEITVVERDKIELKYLNKNKPDIVTNEKQLERGLGFGTLRRVI